MARQHAMPDDQGAQRELSPRAIGGLILLALLAGLAIAGWWARSIVSHVEEFPQASDSFGYLQLAQDIRAGHAPNGGERFTASSEHAREIVAHLRGEELPVEQWESAVAPAAYHYAQRSGKIINQYPPGAGWMLAVFPPGRALAAWYILTLALIAAAAIATAGWTWRRASRDMSIAPLLPAALVFLALHTAVNVLGTTVSYSVDFFILAALPAVGFLWAADRTNGWRRAVFLTLAGIAMGWAVTLRIAAALFLPGIALAVGGLTPPGPKRRSAYQRMAWLAGLLLGILPLLIHQSQLTGSPLGSTYARADTAGPELQIIGTNLAYYFAGDGALANWALIVAAMLFAVGVIGLRGKPLFWRIATVLAIWAVPTGYFLLHRIATAYYQFPTIEMTLLLMAAMLAAKRPTPEETKSNPKLEKAITFAVLLAAAVHVSVALIAPKPIFAADANVPQRTFALPQEVKDPRAWVLAERYSGTLWATHGVYAMYMTKADAPARQVMWRLIRGRGGPIYLFDDRPAAAIKAGPHVLIRESSELGATSQRIGEFEGAPVWRVKWGGERGD